MMIDKISGINPINNVQGTRRTQEPTKTSSLTDTISVSNKAKEMAEMYYMNQVAAETPDVREDKIAEIREKLKDPSYLNNAVIASAAEHIMESFGI